MSACRSCGQSIVWAKMASGRKNPMQLDPGGMWLVRDGVAILATTAAALGAPALEEEPRYTSHFAACPDAAQYRKP